MEESPQEKQAKKVSDHINDSLIETLNQITKGFKIVMIMYTIAFYFGILLIIIAVLPIFFNISNETYSAIFGGLGIIDLTAFLVFKPAEDLQYSRGNLARIMTAFTTWINDLKQWIKYIDNKANDVDPKISLDEMIKISELNIKNVLKILDSSGYSLKVTKSKKDEK